ncbi:MAG: hypothetical protein ACTSRG_06405 [Candidatus Helarchaeota archaeon]
MLDVHKLNQIKLKKRFFLKNRLHTPGMDVYKEPFEKLFGNFICKEQSGDHYFETDNGIIFARYRTALEKVKGFGLKSEIVLKEKLWRIKKNGKWFLMSEYFAFLPEDTFTKATKMLKNKKKIYIRWPMETRKDYIIVTNGEYAVMIPPAKINIIKGVPL